ncbi:MAG: hypothetical protein ACWGQW_00535 [bacterium]
MSPIYRDDDGHFISRARALELGVIDEQGNPIPRDQRTARPTPEPTPEPEPATLADEMEEEEEEEEAQPDTRTWAEAAEHPAESVFVDTGRGTTAEVPAGSPFAETIDRIADENHYGGYYRVWLNATEIVRPEEAPETIEPGMRIAITPYDKVG